MMKRLLSLPISAQLQLIVLLALLPALGVIVYDGIEQRSYELNLTQSHSEDLVDAIAAKQEAIAAGAKQLLIALSAMPQVQALDRNFCNTLFVRIVKQNSQYAAIIGFDTRGDMFALSAPITGPLNARDRKYFIDALKKRDFSAGEYVISKSTQKPVMHFAYPVMDEQGSMHGVIAVSIDLSSIRNTLGRATMPEGTTIVLLDHRGTILHRMPDFESFRGRQEQEHVFRIVSGNDDEGAYTTAGLDRVKRRYAFKRLRLKQGAPSYLYIRVGIPEQQAFAAAWKILRRNLASIALAAMLGSAASWFLGNSIIASRIRDLVKSANSLGRGELTREIPHTDEKGELGELATAFDEMRAELATRNEEQATIREALQKSYRMTREILERSPFGIYVVNRLGVIEYANSAIKVISGNTAREVTGINIIEFAPYRKAGLSSLIHQALSGKPFFFGPVEYASHFSQKVSIRNFTGIPFEEAGEKKAIVFVEDVTAHVKAEEEKRSLQHQLLQAQKMESLGRLAGGIAHDFNNILSAIIGYSELALLKISENNPLSQLLNIIKESGEKAAGLTYQLLAFSRNQILEIKSVNINTVIESMSNMLSRVIGEDIRLEIKTKQPLHNVLADKGQLEQVLMNIVINAQDAMTQGGNLTITTDEIEIGGDNKAIKAGLYVTISVQDNGTGMTKEIQDRIFEPFFTTKALGKGTGLGLATAYGIIRQHDGDITVDSELGKGTRFTCYLPATRAAGAAHEPGTPSSLPHGTETILVVDDEQAVRNLVTDTLSFLGYQTLSAEQGEAALEIGRTFPEHIHLLLTDVVMPGMSGKELADRFRLIHPEAKTLFMSGYTDEKLAAHDVFGPDSFFLQKPVSPSLLANKLRELLDA